MKSRKQNGFTLIEALIAAMLLGMVITALAAASGAFTMANGYGVDLSTAEFLIEQVRERTTDVDFNTLLASYDGQTYNPPIDVEGATLPDFSAFTQSVEIDYVQPDHLDQVSATATDFVRVTVTITKNSTPINSTSWIRANL